MIELVNFLDETYEKQFESLHWRNSKNVAKFFKLKQIDKDTHVNWLKSLHNENPQNFAFFIKSKDSYVGVTYIHSINYTDKIADWGIYIHKEDQRGKGTGKKALLKSLGFLKDNLMIDTVFLDVMRSNESAKSLYEKCGFNIIQNDGDNFLRYKKGI